MNEKAMIPQYNALQTLKRRFFAMRNGIISDVLRKSGSQFRIIFGLNLPQIVEIASECPHSEEFATTLWNNTSTRESMLIAPMLYPRENFSQHTAREWISQIPEAEVADVLCHRLLRYQPYALQIARDIIANEKSSDMERYTALRLTFNLVSEYPDEALVMASNPQNNKCSMTSSIALRLAEEAKLVKELF